MRRLALALLPLLAVAATGTDRPPPKPDDPEDFIRYIFEINDCVLTEQQLYDLYLAEGYGMMGANNAVIAIAGREDIEVIERDPFTYRYFGSDYCGF